MGTSDNLFNQAQQSMGGFPSYPWMEQIRTYLTGAMNQGKQLMGQYGQQIGAGLAGAGTAMAGAGQAALPYAAPVIAAGAAGYYGGRGLGRMGLDQPVENMFYEQLMKKYRNQYGAENNDPRMGAGY